MMNPEEVVALVPVREGSQRIMDKNFRPFGGYPTLLHHKIEQLRQSGCFSHIYVSSDSDRVRKIIEECGAEFLPRDPIMCTSSPRWDEVVVSVMGDIPGNPHVAWAMVTSPLFDQYAPAVERYLESLGQYDSLVAVKSVREYLIDEQCRPLFVGFGPWHPYTTEIKPFYAISDALFIARKSDQVLWRYWFGRKPYLLEISNLEAIDINFEDDLHMAYAAELYLSRKK
jgi:N-acylneuraminate cytidylyltransferase